MKNVDAAKTQFLAHLVFSRYYLTKINQYVNDHMNKAPDEINFADAGDAAHLKNLLKEIYNNFNIGDKE